MTGNLNVQQVAASQTDKEAAINAATLKLDRAMTDFETLDVTSGNVSITQTQWEENIHFFVTGATTAGRTVTTYGGKRLFSVESDSSNTQSFDVVQGTTTITVTPGDSVMLYSDGTADGLRVINSPETVEHFEPGTPATSTTLYMKVASRPFTMADELAGSQAYCKTAPNAQTIFDVQVDGVSIGSITFANAANTATFSTSGGGDEVVAAGSRLEIISPANLNSMADVAFNLKAWRS